MTMHEDGNTKYNYNKGKYGEIRKNIQERDWKENFKNKTVEESCGILKGELLRLRDEFVPTIKKIGRQFPKWMTAKIKKSIKKE